MRARAGSDLFRRSLHHDLPAVTPSFRPQVYHIVGTLDDVQVMLDDKDGTAFIHQTVETVEPAVYVGEVQSRYRLVSQ